MNPRLRTGLRALLAGTGVLLIACAQTRHEALSPDGRICVAVGVDEAGAPAYEVLLDGKALILPSRLGFAAAEADLASGFTICGVERASHDEEWTQPWGENKLNRDCHNQMAVRIENEAGTLTLRFRVFDDGVGFRYECRTTLDSLRLTDERTEFRIAGGDTSWSIPASFETYELLYRTLPVDSVADANTPFTFRTREGVYASIHEAALTDFAEMTLRREGAALKADLAPWPDGVKVRTAGGFVSPWRTLQIGRKPVDLINSSLILNLNEPCALESTDWIRPMKYIGVWWGMHLGVETWTMDSRHGATTDNALRYIDFAAENDIDAVLFEGWNRGWESWGGMQTFDFTEPYADFEMEKIVRYARERGVELIGHHETGGNVPNYERQLDAAYKWYADLGVHCVKTGYAGAYPDAYLHHSQYGVRHYRRVVETAARYRTTLNVHEPVKATGIRRTWPNMMTREGARGMEWNAWSSGNPPEHYELLPFTRLLGGPMDYTPGTFDILFERTRNLPQRRKWNDQDRGDSRVNTTLAKQLANWVVLYSPLQMASDMIEHYEGHPAFQFFRDFDPDCDWSQALDGRIGEYVAVVRRAGERYFLGATTNHEARTLRLPLDFLKPGVVYAATIYADAPDADWKSNPTAYTISERRMTAADSLDVAMASGGGQAVVFRPAGEECR